MKKSKLSNYINCNKENPAELTEEETFELVNQISMCEFSRRTDIQRIKSQEDARNDILLYLYGKSTRGKKGMAELKDNLSMDHFINTLHMETRNNICGTIRKNKNQNLIYNTVSFDLKDDKTGKDVSDYISDSRQDNNIEEVNLLSNIDNTEDNKIVIRYRNGKDINFSFRNMAKLYLDLGGTRKVNSKDLLGIFVDKETNLELSEDKIKHLMNSFKTYILEENLLGGNI